MSDFNGGGQGHPSARQRGHYSTVQPVSQSIIEFRPRASADHFSIIRKIVLEWVERRAGRPLPSHAWDGEAFELEDVGSQRTAAVSLEQPRFWAARLDDADRNVAQRTWVTEIGIATPANGIINLGSRLLCVARRDGLPFMPSIQTFVRAAVEQIPGAYVEGRYIDNSPWLVESENDVEELATLISNTARRLDVIVCAVPEGSEFPEDATVDVQEIHQRTYGAAHVVVITSSASFVLSDYLGKEFSTFRGAVRTYKPGFDRNLDEPFAHPLTLPARIVEWPDGGVRAFERLVIARALFRSAHGRDAERQLPPFTEVRRVASQLKLIAARETGKNAEELLGLAQKEIDELLDAQEKDKLTYEGLVEQYELERNQALAEAQQIRAANFNLQMRLRLLQERNQSEQSNSVPIPSQLEVFEDWCREHLPGEVDVHNRAIQGVKKSMYQDTKLIYQSLLLLRDLYVPMKTDGGLELKQKFDQACHDLGLSEEPTFSGDRWGEQGEEYFVRYAGRKCLLDRHLKKGNGRDERRCFRLYFFWDEESKQVVVGWLPSHLDTRIT